MCGKYFECYLIAAVIRTRAPRSAIVRAYAGALEWLAGINRSKVKGRRFHLPYKDVHVKDFT